MFNLERDLKKRMNAARSHDTARGFLLMRVAALLMKQLYDAIRFLCADEYTKGRKPEYIFCGSQHHAHIARNSSDCDVCR